MYNSVIRTDLTKQWVDTYVGLFISNIASKYKNILALHTKLWFTAWNAHQYQTKILQVMHSIGILLLHPKWPNTVCGLATHQ